MTVKVMISIKPLCIDAVDMTHAAGKVCIRGLNQDVVMLCEALDYVKFDSRPL